MTAGRVIVWRHGRTRWNVAGRYQGHGDIGLDDVGRRQVAAAANMIKVWQRGSGSRNSLTCV